MSNGSMFNRRRFIQLGAGAAVTAALAACASERSSLPPATEGPMPQAPGTAGSTSNSAVGTTAATGPASTTVTSVLGTTSTDAGSGSVNTLVVVQLNGGNDALNTLVPSDGRYRDARPTLAIPEADLVALAGITDWSLH